MSANGHARNTPRIETSLFPAVLCWELALGPAPCGCFWEEKGKKGRGDISSVQDRFFLAQMAVQHQRFGGAENVCVMPRFYITEAKLHLRLSEGNKLNDCITQNKTVPSPHRVRCLRRSLSFPCHPRCTRRASSRTAFPAASRRTRICASFLSL